MIPSGYDYVETKATTRHLNKKMCASGEEEIGG